MFRTRITELLGIEYPIICGAMYPCSDPELVASVSEAGGIGIVQPLSFTYVHGYDLREALRYVKQMTKKPYGMNIIVEKSSRVYERRMYEAVDIALDEGCRFFITALGNPEWVVKKVKEREGIIFHDVTEKKWAEKDLSKGIDGLICVNNRAGGHAGTKTPAELIAELYDFGVPLICAGGIGNEFSFIEALNLGYDGIQMGTRFIATQECHEKDNYKKAIIDANERDIVLTERVTGVPLSVIRTPYVEHVGTRAGPIARFLLKNRWTKHWMRLWYTLYSVRKFKNMTQKGGSTKDYWQAGKSVAGIHSIEKAEDIIQKFVNAYLSQCECESCECKK